MNKLLLIASAVLVTSGCVNDSPLYVTGFFPLDPEGTGACELTPGGVSQYAGSLDLSGSGSYQLVATLRSELAENLDTRADDVVLVTGRQRNTVILDSINFTYTSTPTQTIQSVTFEPETVPITIVLEPGGTSNVRMGLLGPKAYEALSKAIVNPGETSNIRARFEFTGVLNSGGRIKSAPITFPLTVFRSGTVCGAGEVYCRNGICGGIGGQDGRPVLCSPITADGGTNCPVAAQ